MLELASKKNPASSHSLLASSTSLQKEVRKSFYNPAAWLSSIAANSTFPRKMFRTSFFLNTWWEECSAFQLYKRIRLNSMSTPLKWRRNPPPFCPLSSLRVKKTCKASLYSQHFTYHLDLGLRASVQCRICGLGSLIMTSPAKVLFPWSA